MHRRPFDPGATLAFLDDIADRFGPLGLPSIEPAWDAAWITCLTVDRRHDAAAQDALADVVVEVDRLSTVPTPRQASAPTALAPP